MLDSSACSLTQVSEFEWQSLELALPWRTRFVEKQPLNRIWVRNRQVFATILSGENGKHLSCSEQDLLCKHVTLSISVTSPQWIWSLLQLRIMLLSWLQAPLQLCSCQEVIHCHRAKLTLSNLTYLLEVGQEMHKSSFQPKLFYDHVKNKDPIQSYWQRICKQQPTDADRQNRQGNNEIMQWSASSGVSLVHQPSTQYQFLGYIF